MTATDAPPPDRSAGPARTAGRAPTRRRSSRRRRGARRSRRSRSGSSARKAFLRLWIAQVVLEPRRLGRALRDPRHRRAAVRQLGRRGQPRHGRARCCPGFFLAHRRRRHHRPLRPAQGHGALRHRPRRPALHAPVRRAASWLLVIASFFIEILTLLWGPAKDASVPHFVPEDKLASANSLSLVASLRHVPDRRCDHLPLLAGRGHVARRLRRVCARSRSTRTWCRCGSTRSRSSCPAIARLPPPDPEAGRATGTRSSTSRPSIREIKDGLHFMRGEAVQPGGDRRARRRAHRRRRDDPARHRVRHGGARRRSAQFGVLLTALGIGAAIGVFIVAARCRSGCRATSCSAGR